MPDREDLYRIFAPHEQGYRSCQPPSEFLGPLVLPPPGRELGIPTPESDALSNALRRCVQERATCLSCLCLLVRLECTGEGGGSYIVENL